MLLHSSLRGTKYRTRIFTHLCSTDEDRLGRDLISFAQSAGGTDKEAAPNVDRSGVATYRGIVDRLFAMPNAN